MYKCLFCHKEMNNKTSKKVFCSDKCRVYFNRSKKVSGGFIYGLKNPIDNKIFYIGKTTMSIDARAGCHISEKKNGKKNNIIQDIIAAGKDVIVEEIEFIESESILEINYKLSEREKFWIEYFNEEGGLSNIQHSPCLKSRKILNWIKANNDWFKDSAICTITGMDKGNFSKYKKEGVFPEKYLQQIINYISKIGFISDDPISENNRPDNKAKIEEMRNPKIKDLREPPNVVKPLGLEKPKSNFTVNTIPGYPTDFNGLLKMAKEGVSNEGEFKAAVASSKLNGNQKSMVLSKLK